jgi:LPS sulfotransferase NodH
MFHNLRKRAVELKDNWSPQIKNIARDLGLLEGHQNYTKFIILGRSRSGSNLLRGLLNAHSQIITFEEMFKDVQNIGWGQPGYPQDGRTLQRFQDNTLSFIEKDLFRKMPSTIQAVGFKIFYYHAYGTPLEVVWDYLKTHTEIRVLHIKRKNILETHFSKKKAELTNSWINLTGEKEKAPAIPLDFEECRQDFEQTRQWENTFDQFFQHHACMEIIYEELAADYAPIMQHVQKFLGVNPEPVQPQTHKQASYRLAETITNYAELKQQFLGTPWEQFFTE